MLNVLKAFIVAKPPGGAAPGNKAPRPGGTSRHREAPEGAAGHVAEVAGELMALQYRKLPQLLHTT